MELKMVEEYEDGSALFTIEASEEEKMAIFREGFLTLLKKLIEEEEKAKKVPALQRSVKHLLNEDMRYGDE
jgi:hypothetical protein